MMITKNNRRSGGHYSAIISCISTTLVLLLLGGAIFFVTLARNFSNQVRSEMPVAVLLKDSIPAEETQKLQNTLKAKPYVKEIKYISKEEGAKEIYESMGMNPGEFIDDNPILAELELRLHGEYTNKDSINRIAPEIMKNAYVADVVYPIEEIDNLNAAIPIVGTVLLSVAGLLMFITFSLIHNTMRMSIYSRRFLIHSMRLVGARWNFIRRPFLMQAFWIGFISATMANVLLGAGMWYISQGDIYLAALITQEVAVITLGSVMVCGLFLTIVCAFFSVNHYLRMRSNKLFLD